MSEEFVDAYLSVMELALEILVPILLLLTLFAWWEARRLWPLKLPFLIALANTVTGACATWLVWTTLYRGRIGPVPIEFLPITATAVFFLCISPALSVAYLVWLETDTRRKE